MDKNTKITILETTDVHGHISVDSFKDREKTEDFSLSRIKTYVDLVRKEEENVIFIDNGDTIQGSPLANYYKDINDNKNLMDSYNIMGVDIWVLGNHDFNYGIDYLKQGIKNINCPVLCGNLIIENKSDEIGHKAYAVMDISGVKVGILGLTTQYIPHWESSENISGFKFISALESAKKYVPIMKEREKCDLIILAYHGGFERDLETGEPVENLTGENEGYALLSSGLDIDVLLVGHQHRLISDNINGIAVLGAGYAGNHIGRIDLVLDEGKNIISTSEKLVDSGDFKADLEIENLVSEDMENVQKILDQKAGEISPSARITNVVDAQIKRSPYIDLINKIQMDYSKADIASVAIYRDDANGLGEDVTMRDIMRNYPYNNTLTKVKITGKDLKEILEHNSKYFCLDENGDLIINPEYKFPKNTIYNYDIYSGIDYCYDYSKPVGERVVELKYKGRDISEDEEIILATNSYRGKGGGDFPVLDGSQIIWESSIEVPQIIYEYIEDKKFIEIEKLPTVKVIGFNNINIS